MLAADAQFNCGDDPPNSIAMSDHRYVPPAQKMLICRLSLTLKAHEIAYHTGISIHTVQAGRPQALTGYHISVSILCSMAVQHVLRTAPYLN